MIQPDVVLTDYALAVECGVLAWRMRARAAAAGALQATFTVFFVATGLSALAGGTVHGFLPDEASAGHAILWPATLLAIGVTATSAWIIGARLLLPLRLLPAVRILAAIALVAYAAAVLAGARDFRLAVRFYLPAAVFLTAAHLAVFVRTRAPAIGAGLAGLALTFAAAFLQQAKVALHPVHFTHNAVYHSLQGVALFLIYLGAHWMAGDEGGRADRLRTARRS